MIVTRTQLGLIRAGKLGTAYVPIAVAKWWKPKRSYVALRMAERVDDEREVRTTPHHITIIGLGKPQAVSDIVGRIEADPGYWELCYPESKGDCVWVAFALGDWRDHARLLAGGRRGANERGYTRSPALALDPDAECVDDEYLARFAKVAEAFIVAKQDERRIARDEAQRNRSRAHAVRGHLRNKGDA